MSQTTTVPVTATFNFYIADDPPEEDDVVILTGNSDKLGPVNLPLQNIRGKEGQFNIDVNGFQVLHHSSPTVNEGTLDFHDAAIVKQKYWPEVTALLRETFGVRAAAIMNTTVRDVSEAGNFDRKNPRMMQSIPPFYVVHGDYTAQGSRSHLRAIVPSFFDGLGSTPYTSPQEREQFFKLQAEVVAAQDAAMKETGVDDDEHWDGSNYKGPRWAMFSIWRPLEPVRRSPLAIMDARDLKSYVELPRVYRNRPGFKPWYKSTNIIARKPPGEQRWYWLPDQEIDEVYAIKLFDSESEKPYGPVLGAAHSAFEIEGTGDLPPRRSTELRAIVIW